MEPNPDQIVRDTFSHKEDAISFFQNTLPAPILDILDLNSLEPLPTTLIDQDLKELQSA